MIGEGKELSEYLHFLDGMVIDKYIYFASSDFNGLYRWNITRHETDFLLFFPDEDVFVPNIYGHVIRSGDNIFFLPIHGKKISIYDKQNNSLDSIDIGEDGYESLHISAYIKLQDRFLLIPADLKRNFWFFYPEERRFEKASQISKKISNIIKDEDSAICRYQGACTFKEEIMISVLNKEYLLNINIIRGEIRKIPIKSFKTNNMFAGNDFLWLVSSDGREIVKWYNEKKYEKISFNDVEEKAFFSIVAYKDTFLLLPWRGDEVKKYNKEKDIWETFIKLNKASSTDEDVGTKVKYCSSGTFGKFILLYPSSSNELICINTDNDYVDMIEIRQVVDFDIMLREKYQRNFAKNKYILESSYDKSNLATFLRYIFNKGQ